jgi:pimeloyl-ACP methyl ester carboxylesterase
MRIRKSDPLLLYIEGSFCFGKMNRIRAQFVVQGVLKQNSANRKFMFRSIIAMLFFAFPITLTAQYNAAPSTESAASKIMETTHEQQPVIYLFSGLGADYRAFQNLRLPGYRLVYINWIKPEKSESMAHYAGRIKGQVVTPDPIIIGLSFGGMIAVELAKQMPVKKMVLISSAKNREDLAGGNSLFFRWKLYKVIPGYFLQQSNFIVNNMFGATTGEDKKILSEILNDSDPAFFRWAMDNIVHWDNEVIPPHLIHIHGTADKIIPYAAVKADYSIEGGGHLMVLNRADTISKIIINYLRK